MATRKWFSTGEAADALGISRDALMAALRVGAPDADSRIGGRRIFGHEDLDQLRIWFAKRGRMVKGGLENA